MDLLEKAEMLAKWAHRNQVDREGMPYWTHCARVAHNLAAAGYDEVVQAIGWLHDVVEDTDVTFDDIWDLIHTDDPRTDPITDRVYNGVVAMTQRPSEDLEAYWTRVKNNADARIVKLWGDIPDNDDEQRRLRLVATLGGERAEAFGTKQHAKYVRARNFLMTDTEWIEWQKENCDDPIVFAAHKERFPNYLKLSGG